MKDIKGTTVLGKYHIDRILGKGSFGIVYKAQILEGFESEKPMVIKASKDLVMLYNEINVIEKIHMYAKNSKEIFSDKVVKSIPCSEGRGILQVDQKPVDLI